MLFSGCEFSEIVTNFLLGNFQKNLKESVCHEFVSSSPTSGSFEKHLILRCEDILRQNSEDDTKWVKSILYYCISILWVLSILYG